MPAALISRQIPQEFNKTVNGCIRLPISHPSKAKIPESFRSKVRKQLGWLCNFHLKKRRRKKMKRCTRFFWKLAVHPHTIAYSSLSCRNSQFLRITNVNPSQSTRFACDFLSVRILANRFACLYDRLDTSDWCEKVRIIFRDLMPIFFPSALLFLEKKKYRHPKRWQTKTPFERL